MKLRLWRAKQVDGRITVDGLDDAGNEQKLTRIVSITPGPGRPRLFGTNKAFCVATDTAGNTHDLIL